MGIYIRGMEMPTSCLRGECPIAGEYCGLWEEKHWKSPDEPYRKRHPKCPLVPVPPHGRLGDFDRLEQMFVDIDNAPYSGFDGTEPFYSAEDAAYIIRLAPTIIPAEEDE